MSDCELQALELLRVARVVLVAKRPLLRVVKRGKVQPFGESDIRDVIYKLFRREKQTGMGTKKFWNLLYEMLGFPPTAGDFTDAHFEAMEKVKSLVERIRRDGQIQIQRSAPFQVVYLGDRELFGPN